MAYALFSNVFLSQQLSEAAIWAWISNRITWLFSYPFFFLGGSFTLGMIVTFDVVVGLLLWFYFSFIK